MVDQIPVLMYHAFNHRPSAISIPRELFAWQMDWLKSAGISVLRLEDVVECIYKKKPFPEKSVVLTFDDGFSDFYLDVFPILASHGFPATIYLVTGFIGRTNNWPGQPKNIPLLDLLTWSQIDELNKGGIEFGAHSVTHPRLDLISYSIAESEIIDSKKAIENRIGRAIITFAYPYGRFDENIRSIVQQYFRNACTTRGGLVHRDHDPYELKRVEVQHLRQKIFFSGLNEPWFGAYVSVRNSIGNLRLRLFRKEY